MNIKIIEKDDYFLVEIEENSTRTQHEITLEESYYKKLTKEKISKKELIKRSFKFLLEREPKEAIFKKFNLKIIESYFSEYEKEISLDL